MSPETMAKPENRSVPVRALARMAATGIYLLRSIPLDLQRAARGRAMSEGTSLHRVLRQALREYAAGSWTPRSEDHSPKTS
jgi:hypothetical protein